jgi:hypothetical protein
VLDETSSASARRRAVKSAPPIFGEFVDVDSTFPLLSKQVDLSNGALQQSYLFNAGAVDDVDDVDDVEDVVELD